MMRHISNVLTAVAILLLGSALALTPKQRETQSPRRDAAAPAPSSGSITFRCSSFAYGNGAATTITITIPNGCVQDNDLMLFFVETGGVVQPPAPSGWTLGGSVLNGTLESGWLFYRIASNEPTSYDWGNGALSNPGAHLRIYRNANIASPIDMSAKCAGQGLTTCTTPSPGANRSASEVQVAFFGWNEGAVTLSGFNNLWSDSTRRSFIAGDREFGALGQTAPAAASTTSVSTNGEGIAVTLFPNGTVNSRLWAILSPARRFDRKRNNRRLERHRWRSMAQC
jgi:hypothetical protein